MRNYLIIGLLIGSLSEGNATMYQCPTSLEGLKEHGKDQNGDLILSLKSQGLEWRGVSSIKDFNETKKQQLNEAAWYTSDMEFSCNYGKKLDVVLEKNFPLEKHCELAGKTNSYVKCPGGCSLVCLPHGH